jgi:UDP-N-acetylglucosamine 2-epimerase (non-hydrolysing)/GDP/UDP-N,N'-diacetylbacillosamine 2-epimerase (hydrolysing)
MAVRDCGDLSISMLVTGMHLDPVHGETWREIEADGFEIAARVGGRVAGDTLDAMAASVGNYLVGMTEALAQIEPEITLVLGDRGEMLAGAMAAAFRNVVVAHLCGGSVSGSIDDSIRHAITKFAHYHLPAFEEHAKRIIQMGEDPATVTVVGLPGGDLSRDVNVSRETICGDHGLAASEPYLLVLQHAVTHSRDRAEVQIVETLEAAIESGLHVLLGNPNDDAGGRAIVAAMRRYAEANPRLHILPPPRSRERFASIMAHAAALVGNSSSGVVEAASVGVPVVNIGDRQHGREHLGCMINADYNRKAILAAIRTALHDKEYRARLVSHASKIAHTDTEALVVGVLRSLDLTAASRPKQFHLLPRCLGDAGEPATNC